VARWQWPGTVLTVTCEHGRQWFYLVTLAGDRPLPHFLHDTPWMQPPGAQWAEDGAENVWETVVIPRSPEVAGQLFPPGQV
jgi:hypothetical protein